MAGRLAEERRRGQPVRVRGNAHRHAARPHCRALRHWVRRGAFCWARRFLSGEEVKDGVHFVR